MLPDLPSTDFNAAVLYDYDLLDGGMRDLAIENQAQPGGGRAWSSCTDDRRTPSATSP